MHVTDIPYLVIIVFGIFLPELYLRMHWSYRVLMIVRLLTLLVTCVLATGIDHLFYPMHDPGTIFTRAFIYIGVCRMIMLSSHQVSERQTT